MNVVTKPESVADTPESVIETRSDIDLARNDLGKKIAQRVEDFWHNVPYREAPPIPRQVLVEVSNACNHACVFCAYSKMTRPRDVLDLDLFKDIMAQAHAKGAREAGLYSGGEPLTVKRIAEYVACVKQLGYEYVYMTTNGTPANEGRIKELIDAGLDSLKFSINGANREDYRLVHGQDHFERAIRNLRTADEYRKASGRQMYLSVSFVECAQNKGTYGALRELVDPYVDEVFFTQAYNQAGQMDMAPPHVFKQTCAVPFARLAITCEGYLRVCCNDYQNFLAAEDLKQMSLEDAWNSPRMQDIRRRHLENRLEGTLCYNCVHGVRTPIQPLNRTLSDLPQI